MTEANKDAATIDEHRDFFAMIAKGIKQGAYEDGSVPNIGCDYSSMERSEVVLISNLAAEYGFKSVVFNFDRILAEDIFTGKVHSVVES